MSSRSPRTPTKTEKEPTPYRALQYLMISSNDKRKEFLRFYKYGPATNAKFVKTCVDVLRVALGLEEKVRPFETPNKNAENYQVVKMMAKIDPSTPEGKRKLQFINEMAENECSSSGDAADYADVESVEEDEVEEMDIPKKKKKGSKTAKAKGKKKN